MKIALENAIEALAYIKATAIEDRVRFRAGKALDDIKAALTLEIFEKTVLKKELEDVCK